MNAVSEIISNRRKLVRDVACLAGEGIFFTVFRPQIIIADNEKKLTGTMTQLLIIFSFRIESGAVKS